MWDVTVSKICKEATNKINALLRIAKHLTMPLKKAHFLFTFSARDANNKLEKLHKRALQIIHSFCLRQCS